MSRLLLELSVRRLRAQVGERLRRGAPVLSLLRHAVAELEAQARSRDSDFLRERLSAVFKDRQFSLLLRANPWLILQKRFFRHSADVVAPHLLSKLIVTADGRAGRIAEVIAMDTPPAGGVRGMPAGRGEGRLVFASVASEPCASVTCVCDGERSDVIITAIEPVDGAAVMEAQAGASPDGDGLYRDHAVVNALGLVHDHQGSELTKRHSAIRMAWDLQSQPMVLGRAGPLRRNRLARIWRWGLPR